MLVRDLLTQYKTSGRVPFSFEFFPPKTDKGWEQLYTTITQLLPLSPAYVSVTYGAGGSTRANTHQLVTRLHQEAAVPVVAHLTCEGSTRREVADILDAYALAGITNILALKGDVPLERRSASDFAFASDLVAFIKQQHPEFGVGVAGFPEGHPGTPNRLHELRYLKQKIDAGADYIVTQLFFDNRDFFDFQERCLLEGIQVPVIAGIMPVTSRPGLERMAELAAGARFPGRLLRSLERAVDEEAVRRIGLHWAVEQISELLHAGVAGIHLYTLNHSRSSLEMCEHLGLTSFAGGRA